MQYSLIESLQLSEKLKYRYLFEINHKKYPHYSNYYSDKKLPHYSDYINQLTGWSLITGQKLLNDSYLYILDIDEYISAFYYNPIIFKRIMDLDVFKSKNVYIDKTVSAGKHIGFTSKEYFSGKLVLESKKDSKIKVELFGDANIHCLLAPSKAYKKKSNDTIGDYKQLSECSIFEVDDINIFELIDELKSFLNTTHKPINNIKIKKLKDNDIDDFELEETKSNICFDIIDRIIKQRFPNVENLFDIFNIAKHSVIDSRLSFYSFFADDGNFPGACIYRNSKKNYHAVVDFHYGKTISFTRYLYHFNKELFDRVIKELDIKTSYSDFEPDFEYDRITQFYNGYIDLDFIDIELFAHQNLILIKSPTGSGKTESVYRSIRNNIIKNFILFVPYTSLVDQAKEQLSNRAAHLSGSNHKIEKSDNVIIATYNKAKTILDKVKNLGNYNVFIDEAHNLITQYNFRSKEIKKVIEVSNRSNKTYLLTATPECLNDIEVDVMIDLKNENDKDNKLKEINIIEYKKDAHEKTVSILLSNYKKNTIDVIYSRNKNRLMIIEELLTLNNMPCAILYSNNKLNHPLYNNIIKNQSINHSTNQILPNGGVILATNLFIDGVNILDTNIGNLYMVDVPSLTDIQQFPARFRNGYENLYILISGSKSKYPHQLNQTELFQKYHNLAKVEKDKYDKYMSDHNKHVEFITTVLYDTRFQMLKVVKDRKILFESELRYMDTEIGEIDNFLIHYIVQTKLSERFNWDVDFRNEYLKDICNFNNVINVQPSKLIKKKLKPSDIIQSKKNVNIKYQKVKNDLFDILKDINKRDLLIFEYKDYIQFRSREYQYQDLLSHPKSNYFIDRFLVARDELMAKNPERSLILKSTQIEIARKTNMYLKRLSNDDLLSEISIWIDDLKKTYSVNVINLDSETITKFFHRYYNSIGSEYFKTKNIRFYVDYIRIIFNVDYNNKNSEYIIRNRWTLNNIYGLDCSN